MRDGWIKLTNGTLLNVGALSEVAPAQNAVRFYGDDDSVMTVGDTDIARIVAAIEGNPASPAPVVAPGAIEDAIGMPWSYEVAGGTHPVIRDREDRVVAIACPSDGFAVRNAVSSLSYFADFLDLMNRAKNGEDVRERATKLHAEILDAVKGVKS